MGNYSYEKAHGENKKAVEGDGAGRISLKKEIDQHVYQPLCRQSHLTFGILKLQKFLSNE